MDITLNSDLLQHLAYRLPAMFGQGVAPATSAAFDASARMIRATWRGWAMGGPIQGISDIKKPSGRLAASINVKKMGAFDATISSDSPHAQRIQDGMPELDMKTTHPYGHQSRVSKEGFPYLIVPFRWGTPNKEGGKRASWGNFIPELIHRKQTSKMKVSERTGYIDAKTNEVVGHMHPEKNYRGEDVLRDEYNWGDRHQGDGHMDGLVRFKGKAGYFTFRVVSAKQLVTAPHSWIRKAVTPIDVVGALAKTTQPLVEDLISLGLQADFGL